MTAQAQLHYLRVINYLNILVNDYCTDENPSQDQRDKNADIVLIKVMSDFLSKYDAKIKKKYTFILNYKNDIFSFLALRVCSNAVSALGKTIDIKILGNLNAEEKEFFKDYPIIGERRAKKIRNKVLITGFNPIMNVENEEELSKDFNDIFHPIARFSPIDLSTIQDFYLTNEHFLYNDSLYMKNLSWAVFYNYPVGMNVEEKTVLPVQFHFDLQEIYKKCDKSVPIIPIHLSGAENDFTLYDAALTKSKEGCILLYVIDGDVDFVKTNLGAYIESRNFPQPINIVTQERLAQIIVEASQEEK